MSSDPTALSFEIRGDASPEQAAAIAAVVGALLQTGQPAAPVDPRPHGWAAAARVESLGIVRRIPGMLDLRYMSAPTRERLTRQPQPTVR
ncbi:MAG: hypothetical protein VKP62_14605 [Candidatus Sericytochromatia bacterium]|nr:hypothetical protein [Candidatus Sericytochromatia bacterium]